jgi:antiviral helicase SKI2
MIIERNRISVMNEAVEKLHEIAQEWKSNQASVALEVDWSKMRQLEFQESLRSRNALEARLEGKGCTICQDFDDHVSIVPMVKSVSIDNDNLNSIQGSTSKSVSKQKSKH